MLKVLIISPHFPPSNAPDMQRIRLILPYLHEYGIEVEVMAVKPEGVASPMDPWLEAGLPPHIPVHRVGAMSLRWSRIPGLGTLTYRALAALRRRGNELLGRDRGVEDEGRRTEEGRGKSDFDLIYFSTTQFGLHVLGPQWKKKFGVPFVMDYQDPWVSDYYGEHPDVVPPGGHLKYAVVDWCNRHQEPKVLRECSGITSVSNAYPKQLARRYGGREIRKLKVESRDTEDQNSSEIQLFQFPAFNSQLFSTVLPFPGDPLDLERVRSSDIRQTVFNPHDGLTHWVYVGVCPASMLLAVRAIFSALADLRPLNSDLRLHFIGTSYAAAGTGVKIVEPLAVEYGLEGMVHESTDRIPYSETMRCLLDADALIVLGTDDPGYTASKIYPYLLAGKPLLGVFHEQSSVIELIRRVGGGTVVAFTSHDSVDSTSTKILHEWLAPGLWKRAVPLDSVAFASHTARRQAEVLAVFFQKVLEH